ncbi:MAG: winged helix-turn-helix transcriptional regulator [Bacillota bacterium]
MQLTSIEKEIYNFIKKNGIVKNRQIADALYLNKRTIQRYKARLRAKGFDIKYKSGKMGGCYIEKN